MGGEGLEPSEALSHLIYSQDRCQLRVTRPEVAEKGFEPSYQALWGPAGASPVHSAMIFIEAPEVRLELTTFRLTADRSANWATRKSEWRASNPRPHDPKSRMHPSTPHPDINLSSFVKVLSFQCFAGSGEAPTILNPLIHLIVSPLGEYFVPDSNRASQA